MSFDLDVSVGTFRLSIAHEAQSHRLAILGPSGSGKSLTLRSLAGLLGPAAGEVEYNNETVRAMPTELRHIGYVSQSLALFPDRTVWEQLLFATDADPGLAVWWLDTLRLRPLKDRFPDQLSGGQRQRVSLAQALSRNPRLVLLDEPFSALDATARQELRDEVRRLQFGAGLSTVLVTHDHEEAALLADDIVVIADGHLLQAGPRHDVYSRPASPQVARMLGMRNFNRARVGSASDLSIGSLTVNVRPHDLPTGAEVIWSVRPEHVEIARTGTYPAQIVDVADLGAITGVSVRLDGGSSLENPEHRPRRPRDRREMWSRHRSVDDPRLA